MGPSTIFINLLPLLWELINFVVLVGGGGSWLGFAMCT